LTEFLNWRGEGAELFYWRKKNNLKNAHKKIFIFFSNDLKLYLRRKKRGQGLCENDEVGDYDI
jgi:hypothetical protein